MGQRLNIEICYGDSEENVIANCYYHWDGYTLTALSHAITIADRFKELGGVGENSVAFAVDLLRRENEGFPEDEKFRCADLYDNIDFNDAASRNEGLIAISKEGIAETRNWEEARLSVDILNKKFNITGCFCVRYEEDALNDAYEYDENKNVSFVQTSIDPFEVPFDEIRSVYLIVFGAIVKNHPAVSPHLNYMISFTGDSKFSKEVVYGIKCTDEPVVYEFIY